MSDRETAFREKQMEIWITNTVSFLKTEYNSRDGDSHLSEMPIKGGLLAKVSKNFCQVI